ncbi:MAG TPA: protein kinase, partial [Planctomycetota bacterium]|nr:protein kinase [Planctomycetota bacterium]
MPYATDGLVGKLALQRGWITSAQLKDALSEQAAGEKVGPRKPLGVILVARGHLTDEKLLDLLEEQRRLLAEQSAGVQGKKDEALFGQILLKQGLATADQLNAALRTQAEAAERGEVPVPRLGQILMTMAPAHAPAIRKTLELQNKALWTCPGCKLRYNLRQAEPGKQYRCKKCGGMLQAVAPSSDLRVDASAYGMNLEVQTDLPPEVAQADLDPASRFDKFVLLETLGRGGAGTVYRAYQKDLKRIVALKLLRAPDDETRQRFAAEAQTAARLKHPNIVAVYETGSVDQVPWLAMEYVDGKPLDQGPRLPWRKAALLLRDVALAVDYAHAQGVLHRDLKPANILVDKEGRPFVTDFGLARELKNGRDLTMTGMVVGTPAYMSPEQARGDRELDGRSDVCALGAVLYEMLTGRTPYAGAEPVDIAMAVIHKEPLVPRRIDPAIPPDLEAICLKAMMKEREARYPTARELAADLQRFAEGEPVTARRTGAVGRVFRAIRRQRARAAA